MVRTGTALIFRLNRAKLDLRCHTAYAIFHIISNGLARSGAGCLIPYKAKENYFSKGGCVFMKTLIGGAIAAVLGIIGLSVWFKEFLLLLAGAIPVMLLLGGGLAVYLGFDEMKDNLKKDDSFDTPVGTEETQDVEKYKSEIDDLKKEIEELKKEKE